MAAALSVKAGSDHLVRFFRAVLEAWERSDVKVLLRSDQEVTLTLILSEVQARRQQRTLVERSPVEVTRPCEPWKEQARTWERCCAQRSTRLK